MSVPRVERVFDVALGAVLLLLALPLMGLCAVLVAIGSGPPVLYRQQRIGRDGRPFEVLKFRSMVRDADLTPWPPPSSELPPEALMRRRDPRVTKIGRLLRRWSLDELPQLFNVLRGDMGLVGPRPVPPEEWARAMAQPDRELLARARPGMTGPYQVAIRRGVAADNARQIESAYLCHHRWRDYLALVLVTPAALLRGGGDLLRPLAHARPGPLSRVEPRQAPGNGGTDVTEALRDLHCFGVLGRTLLFDPVAARAFSVGRATVSVLGRCRDTGLASPPADLAPSEQETWSELAALGRWLSSARAALRQRPQTESMPSECRLMLDITRACTLRCAYCYCRDTARQAQAPTDMSWEVASAAVDLLALLAREWHCPGFLNFTGGEPLLRFDFLKQLVEHTAAVASREHVELRCSFGITNGTVAPPELREYLSATRHVISVSIDGPASSHDANRTLADGRGSHARAVALAQHLMQAGVLKSVGATVTADNPYPEAILKHLVGLGFRQVVIKPARLPRGHTLAFTDSNLQPLLDSYAGLTALLAERSRAGQVSCLLAILNPMDYFGRFLIRTLQGIRVEHRCPAARSSFAVSTDGSLYPCSSFCDTPQFLVGSVFAGVDWESSRCFCSPPVQRKRGCAQCWARHMCGGGCAYAGYAANRSVAEPDAAKCKLIRHLCELSIWFWTEVAETCPSIAVMARSHLSSTMGQMVAAQRRTRTLRRTSYGVRHQD